jgi:hypothetical protein
LWTPNSPGVQGRCRSLAQFGWSLFAANFGRSARADLAIGSPAQFTNPGDARIGTVNVLYGSATGLTATGNQLWNLNRPGIPGTTQPNDQYGFSLG